MFPELGPELGPKSSCFSGPDGDAGFPLILFSEHERHFSGFDDKIVAIYARKMTSVCEAGWRQLPHVEQNRQIALVRNMVLNA